MQDQLREELARETVTSLLDTLRASAKIEKFNIDGSKVDPAAPAKPAAPAVPARPAAPATGK
jgi:peptidyl-prolyl cis-trans isomerase C